MTDENKAFVLRMDDKSRKAAYQGVIYNMRDAVAAANDMDEDREREACVLAHDLLSEVMGA